MQQAFYRLRGPAKKTTSAASKPLDFLSSIYIPSPTCSHLQPQQSPNSNNPPTSFNKNNRRRDVGIGATEQSAPAITTSTTMALPTAKTRAKLEVAVERPTPYAFDLGLLLAHDENPITTSTPAATSSMGVDPLEAQLIATARDGAQGLISTARLFSFPLSPPLPFSLSNTQLMPPGPPQISS